MGPISTKPRPRPPISIPKTRPVSTLPSWRRVVSLSALHGVPAPVFSSSLSYYDGVRSERLPAALIQGQRDFFGAHTYKRVDAEGSFHILWAEDGRTEVVSS